VRGPGGRAACSRAASCCRVSLLFVPLLHEIRTTDACIDRPPPTHPPMPCLAAPTAPSLWTTPCPPTPGPWSWPACSSQIHTSRPATSQSASMPGVQCCLAATWLALGCVLPRCCAYRCLPAYRDALPAFPAHKRVAGCRMGDGGSPNGQPLHAAGWRRLQQPGPCKRAAAAAWRQAAGCHAVQFVACWKRPSSTAARLLAWPLIIPLSFLRCHFPAHFPPCRRQAGG
jgi:hypothetical protein